MKIKIDFGYASTEMDTLDMKLCYLPGRKSKGERGGSICVKDGMNFQVSVVDTGDLESGNELAKELVRRFNDCPYWLKDVMTAKKFSIVNFVEQKYHLRGEEDEHQYINLIKRDLSIIVSLERKFMNRWYIRDIKLYDPQKDDIIKLFNMIFTYLENDQYDIHLDVISSTYVTEDILKELGFIIALVFSDGNVLMRKIISKRTVAKTDTFID